MSDGRPSVTDSAPLLPTDGASNNNSIESSMSNLSNQNLTNIEQPASASPRLRARFAPTPNDTRPAVNRELSSPSNARPAPVTTQGSFNNPGRRPSQYNFTDPNAASAASFSAAGAYQLPQGGHTSPPNGPTRRRMSGDSGRENDFWLQSQATVSPTVEQTDGGNFEDLTGAAGSARRRLSSEDEGTQSPRRRGSRRMSLGWLNRDSDLKLGGDEANDYRPSQNTVSRPDAERRGDSGSDHESQGGDVCVPQEGDYSLDFDAVAEVIGSAATKPVAPRDTWKKYQDPPQDPRYLFYSEKTGVVRGDKLESLLLPTGGGTIRETLTQGPFWIDVTDPSHSEMVTFSRLFGIHPLTIEDIQTEETREKCEIFLHYYFICMRTFDSDEDSANYMQPINVFIVVMKECVLSFHCQAVPHPNNVMKRIDQLRLYGLHVTPDWINYALIDDITDGFMPLLKFIELEVDSIDDLVLILKESEQSDMLRRIGHARKKVMQLLRLLSTKADVLKTVIKRCGQRLSDDSETSLYLGDIQDHAIAMVQNLSHYEKTLGRAHSNYLAQISIEITVASNKTNDVVMKMTAMASILLPLNVVTGLFGMNVTVPGQAGSIAWFYGIVLVMIAIASLVYWWARKYKLV